MRAGVVLKPLAAAVVGGGVLWTLYSLWAAQAKTQAVLEPRPITLAAVFVASSLYWIFGAVAWTMTVRSLGGRLRLRKGFRVYFLGNLGRYVPGKLWYAAGRAYLASKENLAATHTSASVLVEAALVLVTALLVSALTLPQAMAVLGPQYILFGLVGLALATAALHPRTITVVMSVVQRATGQRGELPALPSRRLVSVVPIYFAAWLAGSLGLFVLLAEVAQLSLHSLPTVAAAWSLSFLAGYIIPFSPAGLGVREGVLATLLTPMMPLPAAVAAAILFRLVLVASEISLATISSRL